MPVHPEDKIRTTIDIFGTTYKMVGTFSQSYMKRISAYVNENMESIAKGNPRLDSQKVAVLALIQMADEYFRLQAKWDAFEGEFSQSKQRIEELRKAFELTEEKERGQSALAAQLQARIGELEA
ncbi:MAG TPA: cell division protein ZapA, partial [Paenibacillus sp.]|nr:cell division protein ZapA [Paenibacillus sp.]